MTQTAYFNSRTLEDSKHKIVIYYFICKYQNKYFLRKIFGNNQKQTHYCLPHGDSLIGKTIAEDHTRILKGNYGLEGKIEYHCTCHYINYATNKEMIFNDICLVYEVDCKSQGKYKNMWYSKKQISRLKNVHPTVEWFILKNEKRKFFEKIFIKDMVGW